MSLTLVEKPRRKHGKYKPAPALKFEQRRAFRPVEVCSLLGFSLPTFWRKAKAGTIKLTYVGPTPFVTAEHLAELLGGKPAE